MAATSISKTPPPNPLIPEKYIDIPTQRLYYLGLGGLCQALKLVDFILSLASPENRFACFRKWLFVDLVYCVLLTRLRLPRLRYSLAGVVLQIMILWLVNAVMFGGIIVNMPAFLGGSTAGVLSGTSDSATPSTFVSLLQLVAPLTFGLITTSSGSRDAHLLGQHTVRMSPISTAHLNPQGQTFCLSSPSDYALVPIVLNNTEFATLKYSITPLGGRGKAESFEVGARELKAFEQSHKDKLHGPQQSTPPPQNTEEEYEYDDDDDESESDPLSQRSSLQRTQSLVHLPLHRPGIIRLERVYDATNNDARIAHSEVVVVPCPRVEFADDDISTQKSFRCEGENNDMQLQINVYGVPPLSLKWLKTVNRQREEFLVEGIEKGGQESNVADPSSALTTSVPDADSLSIPLTVSLPTHGTYLYALEEITDGVGNTVYVGGDIQPVEDPSYMTKTKNTRSFVVLQRSSVSFAHCSADNPTSLLIGSDSFMRIKAATIETLDSPLDVVVNYQPPMEANKKHKPWKKSFKMAANSKLLDLTVNTPGDYQITGVKGKFCTGIVLAPETCRVVEKPLPSADIEWKRIHECSGDTGVSASLILRGTPPFQLYYTTQRDKEKPKEEAKTFSTSRAELTIRPESSGHYTFSFASISDANYRRVELRGPSIEQVIHPVAFADFAQSHGAGTYKKMLSSCSGDTVDIEVALRGTPPWTLGLQIIGPQTIETLTVDKIDSPRKRITIPIPKELQKSGGTFEIDLVSVEDASKCKRKISVPGITVRVKRVIPTVQFYGKEQNRHVLIRENEKAKLPLRLTGTAPWNIRYRRRENPGRVYSANVQYPNDDLSVEDQGVYEIMGISDSQCPGSVVADGSTYEVRWISRPSAKVASTLATHEASNGSYILLPICQDSNGHVDLELTGRPPYQILYNIAQSTEQGGTRLLEQQTHNSIQPRTRFALRTDTPGRIYYEVKQVGDAAYPLTNTRDTVIPRSQRLLFEQQVSVKPSARFRGSNGMVYCLSDAFTPQDLTSSDGIVVLEGTPPFTLTLSILNIASRHVDWETIQILTNIWRLDLPDYKFSSVGPHRVTLESVKDSSNCERTKLDQTQSIRVDVAETAAIIPFERSKDICVGDTVQFQLEGIPPWTVGYKVNSKSHMQEVKAPPFFITAQQPGDVSVTSIAHQHKMCKAPVTDIDYKVHALPSAQVGHGKKVFQDIHEGDQAEIVFSLVGEPPFTFTYQRSELAPRKGKPAKVMETHTVSRILTHQYSIFSALEGTWTVTSISDKHCRYPPNQPDNVFEKAS